MEKEKKIFLIISTLAAYVFLKEKYPNYQIDDELCESNVYELRERILDIEKYAHIPDKSFIIEAKYNKFIELICANEFKEEIKEFENLRGFCIENYEEIDGDYEDSYAEIRSIGYRASWIVPKEELSENSINSDFLEFVRNWLAPEGTAGYNVNYVDCKLLTLFKEGKIDWNTLRTLVYSNCSV